MSGTLPHRLSAVLGFVCGLALVALTATIALADGPDAEKVKPLANVVLSDYPASVVAVSNDGLTLDRASLPDALKAGRPWSSPSSLPRHSAKGQTGGLEDLVERAVTPPGLLRPDFMIGPDDRTRVNPTTSFPWSAIAHLEMTFPRGSGTCTGWFIGPHTIATAGHCVYGREEGGWATRIRVIPARNSGQAPYGAAYATRIWAARDWVATEAPPHDYGAIKIGSELGQTSGWFGFSAYPDTQLNGITINTAGYPGDKPFGTQWFTHGQITAVNSREVFFNMDIWRGQSGSPAWRRVGDSRYVVAIVAYGSRPYNFGTRITETVSQFLAAALQG